MEHISGRPSSGQGHKTAVFITGFNLEVTGSESIGIPDESDLEGDPGGRGCLDVSSGSGDAEILAKVIGGLSEALKTRKNTSEMRQMKAD